MSELLKILNSLIKAIESPAKGSEQLNALNDAKELITELEEKNKPSSEEA